MVDMVNMVDMVYKYRKYGRHFFTWTIFSSFKLNDFALKLYS